MCMSFSQCCQLRPGGEAIESARESTEPLLARQSTKGLHGNGHWTVGGVRGRDSNFKKIPVIENHIGNYHEGDLRLQDCKNDY